MTTSDQIQLSLPFGDAPVEPPFPDANDDRPAVAMPLPKLPSETREERPAAPVPADAERASMPARSAHAENLQEVMDGIAPGLSKLNDEMRSAIRTMARGIGRKPGDIPTEASQLRSLIVETTPAKVGVAPKRWANIRSLVLKAMQQSGVSVMPGRDTGGPNMAWRTILGDIAAKGDRHALSRFATYCSHRGIGVTEVTEKVFRCFSQALQKESLSPNPMRTIRSTAKAWNRVGETAPSWPSLKLSRPADTRRYTLPAETFPVSFHDDREAYLTQKCNPDPFADHYSRPLRPDTVLNRRKAINQIASALVETGFPPSEVINLAVLTDPRNARSALGWLRDRNGGTYTPSLASKAELLQMLALHWAKNADNAGTLKSYASGFRRQVKRNGMTAKNRDRLRQFDLDANVSALVLLPLRIFELAKASKLPTEDMARQVMFGLAVEILLVAPMRIKNLAQLDVEKNLVEVRRGRAATRHIVIPDFDTKSGAPYEMELPRTTQRLLATYLDRYRPLLVLEGSPYLFPGKSAIARNRSGFGAALSEFILRQTGLKMNPHIFRHLAAKLHLRANPQQIEIVRLFLSHASSETTEKFYADMKADHAFKSYDATIQGLRNTIVTPVLPPARPRRSRPRS